MKSWKDNIFLFSSTKKFYNLTLFSRTFLRFQIQQSTDYHGLPITQMWIRLSFASNEIFYTVADWFCIIITCRDIAVFHIEYSYHPTSWLCFNLCFHSRQPLGNATTKMLYGVFFTKLCRLLVPVGSWRKLLAPRALPFQRHVHERTATSTRPVVTSHGLCMNKTTVV